MTDLELEATLEIIWSNPLLLQMRTLSPRKEHDSLLVTQIAKTRFESSSDSKMGSFLLHHPTDSRLTPQPNEITHPQLK